MFNKNIYIEIIGTGRTIPGVDAGFTMVSQEDFAMTYLSREGKRNILKRKEGEPDPTWPEIQIEIKKAIDKIGFDKRPFFSGPVEELGTISSVRCLENANFSAKDLDVIIGSTNTNGAGYSDIASYVNAGLSKTNSHVGGTNNAWCFDVKGACVGGLTALNVAIDLIGNGRYKNILIVAAEKTTTLAETDDWFSSNLFGDAGSAILVRASDKKHLIGSKFISDPTNGKVDFISCRSAKGKFQQNGQAVHKFVGTRVPFELIKAAEENDILKGLDHLVLHQPSKKTCELFKQEIKDKWKQFKGTIHEELSMGNMSSASIYWIFAKLVEEGKIKKGQTVGFLSFGAGLQIGIIFIKY